MSLNYSIIQTNVVNQTVEAEIFASANPKCQLVRSVETAPRVHEALTIDIYLRVMRIVSVSDMHPLIERIGHNPNSQVPYTRRHPLSLVWVLRQKPSPAET